jgi:hypothetical protein
MESVWTGALWSQFGAAIDMLENAVVACPDSLWREQLWGDPPPADFPPRFAEFWYVTYHTLIWLDLYLAGVPEEEFAPPPPFMRGVLDSAESQPNLPYTKEQLLAYLAPLRQKCRAMLTSLTDEQARRTIDYPWIAGQPVSFLELQLYSMRHIQEHTAQLSLFLGQHGAPDEAVDWNPRAKEGADTGDH